MRIGAYQFGSVTINGETYHTDIVIDGEMVRKRVKGPSKKYREKFGHIPLTAEEEIPWDCRQLIVGTGQMGQLPIVDGFVDEAARRQVKLLPMRTQDAIKALKERPAETNAVLHLTC